jgi:BirA family biotin operon repressor/biotin-[acetyl-CoA-carboxylase] ligase
MQAAQRIVRVHLPTVDSTNTYAKTHFGSFDKDAITAITADEQTAGRGRSGRIWSSTGEDVKTTLAFALPMDKLATAYQLSPLMSVVARRTLLRVGVDTHIKWPNDLIMNEHHKIGGILCEAESGAGGLWWFALGIGINVNSTPEDFGIDRPIWPLSTISAEIGKKLDVTALTDDLIKEFAEVSLAAPCAEA